MGEKKSEKAEETERGELRVNMISYLRYVGCSHWVLKYDIMRKQKGTK